MDHPSWTNLHTNWASNDSSSDNSSVYKYGQTNGSSVQTSYLDSSRMKTNYPDNLSGRMICLYPYNPSLYNINRAIVRDRESLSDYFIGWLVARRLRFVASLPGGEMTRYPMHIGVRAGGAGGSAAPPVPEIFGQNAQNSGNEEKNVKD